MVCRRFQISTNRFERRVGNRGNWCHGLNRTWDWRWFSRELGQISLGRFELGQLIGRATVVKLCSKLCLRRQGVSLDTLKHITIEKHAEATLLWLSALAANGEGVIPTIGVEQARHQRRAKHITNGLSRHASTQSLHLLARDKVTLHNFGFVNQIAGTSRQA
jgi:hypothetical protein